MLSKPEASIKLISEALDAGIVADYVLMDTWFTTEPMIQSILELGLDVIGMVKQLKQTSTLNKFKEYNVTMAYAYYKQNGDCIMLVKVYPEDYK